MPQQVSAHDPSQILWDIRQQAANGAAHWRHRRAASAQASAFSRPRDRSSAELKILCDQRPALARTPARIQAEHSSGNPRSDFPAAGMWCGNPMLATSKPHIRPAPALSWRAHGAKRVNGRARRHLTRAHQLHILEQSENCEMHPSSIHHRPTGDTLWPPVRLRPSPLDVGLIAHFPPLSEHATGSPMRSSVPARSRPMRKVVPSIRAAVSVLPQRGLDSPAGRCVSAGHGVHRSFFASGTPSSGRRSRCP